RADLRRATRGKQTSNASNRAESQNHGAKGPRVRGGNAKQQALDIVPRRDGQDNAEDQPVHNQPNSVSEEKVSYLAPVRSHGHADADFPRAASDRIGQNRIKTQR